MLMGSFLSKKGCGLPVMVWWSSQPLLLQSHKKLASEKVQKPFANKSLRPAAKSLDRRRLWQGLGLEELRAKAPKAETAQLTSGKARTRKGEDRFAAKGPLSSQELGTSTKQKPYACKLLCSPLDARMVQSMQSHVSNSAAFNIAEANLSNL